MTTPNGAIVFNATTGGSDTDASGLGPATAVTGTGASLNATTTVDVSADSPDLSGVTAGDLLWVKTSSGQQYSIIASVDNTLKTVTVDVAYSVTESSRTWAIGGKRATWDHADSRQLITDGDTLNWTIETETDQTLTSAINMDGITGMTFRGSSSTLRTITQTVNEPHFQSVLSSAGRNVTWQWLKGVNSFGGTKTNLASFWWTNSGMQPGEPGRFENCEFGDATNSLYHALVRTSNQAYYYLENCYIHDCINDGIENLATSASIDMRNCRIVNNGGWGVSWAASTISAWVECVIADNGSGGVLINRDSGHTYYRCLFEGNGGDGVDHNNATSQSVFLDCVFSNNGGYGLGGVNDLNFNGHVANCIFYNNTSGNTEAVTLDSSNYEASVDPFTSPSTYDVSLTGSEGTTVAAQTKTLFNATTSRPFRWLDNSAGGGGSSGGGKLIDGGLIA